MTIFTITVEGCWWETLIGASGEGRFVPETYLWSISFFTLVFQDIKNNSFFLKACSLLHNSRHSWFKACKSNGPNLFISQPGMLQSKHFFVKCLNLPTIAIKNRKIHFSFVSYVLFNTYRTKQRIHWDYIIIIIIMCIIFPLLC